MRPTRASMSWTTTPMDAKIAAAAGSLAFSTELQHWIAPVLHVEAGALLGAAVATARIAARVKTLENMVEMRVVVNVW